MRTRSSTKLLKTATSKTPSSAKSKILTTTQRTQRHNHTTTTITSTSSEMRPATPFLERSPSPDSHVSGGSLGTRSFSLASLVRELENVNHEIWGTDPTDPTELSDDSDEDEVHLEDTEVQHVGVMDAIPPKLTGCGVRGYHEKKRPNRTHNYYVKEARRKIIAKVKHAKATQAVFSTFNYADAVGADDNKRRQNAAKVETTRTRWLDGRARVGYSKDGVPIVYHIPGAISGPVHDHTFKTFMKMGKIVKLELGGGADSSGRNAKDSYRIRRGELSGIIKLVMLWHAIGHPNDEPVISGDYIKTGAQFSATTNAISQISLLSHTINTLIREIDPVQYNALKTLRQKCLARHPFLKALSHLDPLVMEGRAIQFNRQTPLHPDRQDPRKSWASMITLGKFTTGGELRIPRLNLEMRYLPRDVVIIRGRLLPHEVKAWGPGQRLSIAHFTHESLWQSYSMVCP